MKTSDWIRVDKRHPCPICKHTDWCLLSADGDAVICPRVESENRRGDAGWLHRLREHPPDERKVRRKYAPRRSPGKKIDWDDLVAQYCDSIHADQIETLADALSVPMEVLDIFGVGWDAGTRCYTVPMYDGRLNVIGIQFRGMNGKKFCLTGSKLGLFWPKRMRCQGYLCVTEGMSDAASLYALEFDAIGRPSAMAGADHVTTYLEREVKRRDVVLFTDADDIGQKTTRDLATRIRRYCRTLRIISPHVGKDMRAWLTGRVTRPAMLAVIDNAELC